VRRIDKVFNTFVDSKWKEAKGLDASCVARGNPAVSRKNSGPRRQRLQVLDNLSCIYPSFPLFLFLSTIFFITITITTANGPASIADSARTAVESNVVYSQLPSMTLKIKCYYVRKPPSAKVLAKRQNTFLPKSQAIKSAPDTSNQRPNTIQNQDVARDREIWPAVAELSASKAQSKFVNLRTPGVDTQLSIIGMQKNLDAESAKPDRHKSKARPVSPTARKSCTALATTSNQKTASAVPALQTYVTRPEVRKANAVPSILGVRHKIPGEPQKPGTFESSISSHVEGGKLDNLPHFAERQTRKERRHTDLYCTVARNEFRKTGGLETINAVHDSLICGMKHRRIRIDSEVIGIQSIASEPPEANSSNNRVAGLGPQKIDAEPDSCTPQETALEIPRELDGLKKWYYPTPLVAEDLPRQLGVGMRQISNPDASTAARQKSPSAEHRLGSQPRNHSIQGLDDDAAPLQSQGRDRAESGGLRITAMDSAIQGTKKIIAPAFILKKRNAVLVKDEFSAFPSLKISIGKPPCTSVRGRTIARVRTRPLPQKATPIRFIRETSLTIGLRAIGRSIDSSSYLGLFPLYEGLPLANKQKFLRTLADFSSSRSAFLLKNDTTSGGSTAGKIKSSSFYTSAELISDIRQKLFTELRKQILDNRWMDWRPEWLLGLVHRRERRPISQLAENALRSLYGSFPGRIEVDALVIRDGYGQRRTFPFHGNKLVTGLKLSSGAFVGDLPLANLPANHHVHRSEVPREFPNLGPKEDMQKLYISRANQGAFEHLPLSSGTSEVLGKAAAIPQKKKRGKDIKWETTSDSFKDFLSPLSHTTQQNASVDEFWDIFKADVKGDEPTNPALTKDSDFAWEPPRSNLNDDVAKNNTCKSTSK